MRYNCAMTALKVTPPANEKGLDADGAEEVEEVAVLIHGCFGRSWASLHLTVAVSMAHIAKKCVDSG